jgi:hypothetical protein
MPLLFEFNPYALFTSGECKYSWNVDNKNQLYLSAPAGEIFKLTQVTNSPFGNDVYAILSTSTNKYLTKAKDDSKKIVATGDTPEDALQLRAQATNAGSDPFLWEDPTTGDFLRVSTDSSRFILSDGTSTEDANCQFSISASGRVDCIVTE